MSDGGASSASSSWWAAPFVPFEGSAEDGSADVLALGRAVDEVLGVAPPALSERTAVARAEGLLAVQERVTAAALRAVADVEARELWRLRAAGSTRTWLRTLPCGDRGQLALARLLADRPVLDEALAAGDVSVRTAGVVARELARVPAHVEAQQLEGVLVDGLGDLLGVWAGAACLEPTPEQEAEFEARRARLADAVRVGLADGWSDAAGQLEPAFVLAAQVLAPAEVESGLRLLVDALQPEADADALGEREHRSRGLVLRKLASGGWSLRAHLTDETGQLLFDALEVREDTHPLQQGRATRAGKGSPEAGVPVEDAFGHGSTFEDSAAQADDASDEDTGDTGRTDDGNGDTGRTDDGNGDTGRTEAGTGDTGRTDAGTGATGRTDAGTGATGRTDAFGRTDDGNGDTGHAEDSDIGQARGVDDDAFPDDDARPDDDETWGASGPGGPLSPFGRAEEGTPLPSKDQRAHDALARLLGDLHGVRPGSGIPAPGHLTCVSSVSALDGHPGAPPGRLVTAKGEVPLTPSQLRRHACRSVLSAVLLDARGRPVGASGLHRHATRRERRAMRAAWGSTCAVNGCTLPGEVPHHAEPFWKSLETALKDLVPVCQHHHHDVHDGHKTLRLRDGRLLDEWGWVRAA